MSDTPETDALKSSTPQGTTVIWWHACTLERQRDEARAEAQRLWEVILRILPGMKAQRPPALGAWNWPYAVKELEEALEGPTVATTDTSRRIMTAHGKEWWVHDGVEGIFDRDIKVEVLFECGDTDAGYVSCWAWNHVKGEESALNIIAWRPADAPDKLPREGGEG